MRMYFVQLHCLMIMSLPYRTGEMVPARPPKPTLNSEPPAPPRPSKQYTKHQVCGMEYNFSDFSTTRITLIRFYPIPRSLITITSLSAYMFNMSFAVVSIHFYQLPKNFFDHRNICILVVLSIVHTLGAYMCVMGLFCSRNFLWI